MVREKPTNALAVTGEIEEFSTSMQNSCSALTEEDYLGAQATNDNFTGVTKECATEVGGKIARPDTGELSQETKDLIKKRQSMDACNPTERIELRELTEVKQQA